MPEGAHMTASILQRQVSLLVQGVRVSAAYCLSNVLRLYAAETDLPWDLPQQEVGALAAATPSGWTAV